MALLRFLYHCTVCTTRIYCTPVLLTTLPVTPFSHIHIHCPDFRYFVFLYSCNYFPRVSKGTQRSAYCTSQFILHPFSPQIQYLHPNASNEAQTATLKIQWEQPTVIKKFVSYKYLQTRITLRCTCLITAARGVLRPIESGGVVHFWINFPRVEWSTFNVELSCRKGLERKTHKSLLFFSIFWQVCMLSDSDCFSRTDFATMCDK